MQQSLPISLTRKLMWGELEEWGGEGGGSMMQCIVSGQFLWYRFFRLGIVWIFPQRSNFWSCFVAISEDRQHSKNCWVRVLWERHEVHGTQQSHASRLGFVKKILCMSSVSCELSLPHIMCLCIQFYDNCSTIFSSKRPQLGKTPEKLFSFLGYWQFS